MIIIDKVTPNGDIPAAMAAIKAKVPNMVAVTFIDNNHIVTETSDYDANGLLDESINDLCWGLGGKCRVRETTIRGVKTTETVAAPDITRNKHYSKVQNKKTLDQL